MVRKQTSTSRASKGARAKRKRLKLVKLTREASESNRTAPSGDTSISVVDDTCWDKLAPTVLTVEFMSDQS